jgi:peroxidase
LPSSRQLSEKFFNTGIKNMQADSNHQYPFELSQQPNLILPQWTYFIEHDLTKTVIGTMINGEPIECCSDVNLPVSPRHLHPACYPLQVTDQDSFYGQLGVTCLNYVRSALAVDSDCKLGPAQQLSEASGTFDLSQLYGYNENITDSLRTHVGGELKKSRGKKTFSLPSTDASDQFCMHTEKKRTCYMAGDPRINLNPYTTVIYAIFHKSHNRIAAALSALNPHWDDAMLFPVARAINVGLYQQVIYREWVVNVLGESVTRSLVAETYDDHLDNRVSNEFATAAIRFSNSMIPGDLFAFEDQMHGHYGNLLEPTNRGWAVFSKVSFAFF